MTSRLFYLLLAVVWMHIGAQEVPKPLPSVDDQLVRRFGLALEAVFGVGIRLQAFLQDDKNDNFLVSPISATVVIGQLILGAEGEFRRQLVDLLALPNSHLYENDRIETYSNKTNVSCVLPYSTLHVQLSGLLKALESNPASTKQFILKQKSAAFVDSSVVVKETFQKYLRIFYDARVRIVDFKNNPVKTMRVINSWVSKNTNGLIKTVLAGPPAPTTASIFTNAVYFKAMWETPFSDVLNRRGHFNVSATKQVSVTYMINLMEQIFYAETADYRMIALPYTNEELSMYIMLPKPNHQYKYDMKNFVQTLKSREILETIAKGRRHDVMVKLPKMTLSNTFSILDQLKKYRVFKKHRIVVNSTNAVDKLEDKVDAFANFTTGEQGDILLTNAAKENLRVDDIVQQVVIAVNEVGTEAAAVSVSTIDYMGGSKNFRIERPFVFFIRHEATSATLFWGTVSNPAP
jgi:serine protease inhibitor